MRILVTGGAGYVGSHVVQALCDAGIVPVVVDSLVTGRAAAAGAAPLEICDLANREALERVFAAGRFEAVIHLAASVKVEESVADPLKYYANNTGGTLSLLEICRKHKVRHFIFSSTAAVYGAPVKCEPITEDEPPAPVSPYGVSKLYAENILRAVAASMGMNYITLRYFNVAGADPAGRIGQISQDATHLIKVACETALGARERMAIYGTDYDTKDGTGVRDYIHVTDLADAHLKALDYLAAGGASQVLNCGYGQGSSVREVIEAVRAASGAPVPVHEQPRRPGDPPFLVADNRRIREVLDWQPQHDSLETIIRTALAWEKKFREEPARCLEAST